MTSTTELCLSAQRRMGTRARHAFFVLDQDGVPSGVVVDLTSPACDGAVLEELAAEGVFRAVPSVAIVAEESAARLAFRLGVASTVRAGGSRAADVAHAFAVCRAIAVPTDEGAARLDVAPESPAGSELTTVIHDMRSPLGVVAGVSAALQDGPQMDRTSAALIALLDRAATQLDWLVRELERIHCLRPAHEHPERVDLVGLVRSVVDGMRHSTECAGKTLRVHAEGAHHLRIDPRDLERVLSNLLANALRHARSLVDVRVESDGSGELSVRVLDDGPGIEPGLLAHMHMARPPCAGRMGLGLVIVRNAVERNGGRVEACNRAQIEGPGTPGACFVVTIPQLTAEPGSPSC